MPTLRSCTIRPELAICGLLLSRLLFAASPATAETDFIVWTSASAGSGGGVSATVTSAVTSGSLTETTLSASETSFVSDFAASYSVLFYRAEPSGPGSIESSLSFSQSLPNGSKLIAVDLDFMSETFTLSSAGTPLTLLEQRETIDGTSSVFPSYNAGTGALIAIAPNPNEFEASVFDASGLSTIDVDFANGLGSGGFIAIALPISSVPAIGPVLRLMLIFCLLGVALIVIPHGVDGAALR